ncbi:DNA-binding protein HU-beta [Chitinivorax tropicus]|uniref:DNA-binding protein HU-beta n=1 Tax=Chitinivorax tropicus TaxID=714531 RepID=A0A840MCH4_9PROT|nr:HU family DNA-binding protein [Chitinivorax tropicus]MBB5017014.1 DNA-binding protein HU-beta [Chitinivorax tropicus]
MRTKKELIDALAERTQQSKTATEAFIDAFGAAVQVSLAKGEEVVLPGIGKFSVKDKAAKTGRNPKTGEAIQIPARKSPAFSAAKALKDAVDVKKEAAPVKKEAAKKETKKK